MSNQFPPLPRIPSFSNYGTSPLNGYMEAMYFPEDAEQKDFRAVADFMSYYFRNEYPEPSLELYSTFDKQYWLPALKVLCQMPDGLWSPGYEAEWHNNELTAECKKKVSDNSIYWAYEKEDESPKTHLAPDDNCDCGIYGSVNLEEIYNYRVQSDKVPRGESVLCVIEPYPDAKVIICRKGWKASKCFISEIVNETMSIDESSTLLSMVWQRRIDVRSVYENR